MSKLVLWGRNTSANVQKVIWALEELGIAYIRKDVGGAFGGLDTPEYGAMNPNRRIPVLQDGDLVLWESSAIVRYLAARYGAGTLWPEDPKVRAIADQWADWANTTFQPAWIEVFVQLVRTAPSKRDMGLIKARNDAANASFRMLDGRLGESPYLAGETPTYADILCGVALYRWSVLDVRRIAMPNVDAWHERLKQRPAFRTGVEVDFSSIYVTD